MGHGANLLPLTVVRFGQNHLHYKGMEAFSLKC